MCSAIGTIPETCFLFFNELCIFQVSLNSNKYGLRNEYVFKNHRNVVASVSIYALQFVFFHLITGNMLVATG